MLVALEALERLARHTTEVTRLVSRGTIAMLGYHIPVRVQELL